MRKICFIADASSPHTQKWVRGCFQLGWKISVISHCPGTIPGAEVIVHPLSLIGFPKYCWAVRRLIKQLKPDIVHAHQFGAHGLYGWFSGCRVLINSAWGTDILVNPRKSVILGKLVRFLINRSTVITSDSHQVTAELIRLGAKREQILTILFGLEHRVYQQLGSVEKPEYPFIICSPRLHEPLYNLPLILEAFQEIYHEFPNVWLWLLGDGSLTPQLKQFACDHRLERVKFWGRVPPEQAIELIAQSHVMVSIPSSDGTPVSMLEAMAARSFPVVSHLPVYQDWITNQENGLMVGFTVKEIAEALRFCINDWNLRQQAGTINRALINDRAIWEDQFQAMLTIYQKAVEQS